MTLIEKPVSAPGSYVWGALSRFGLAVAIVTAVLDQASKLWVLYILDLETKRAIQEVVA